MLCSGKYVLQYYNQAAVIEHVTADQDRKLEVDGNILLNFDQK